MAGIRNSFMILLGIVNISLFQACEGIFGGIYDNPGETSDKDFGFIEINENGLSGTIYVHTEDYKRWVYVNLTDKQIDSTRIENSSGEETPLNETSTLPSEWDFAIHRYDAKTNGGAVLETSMTSIDEIRNLTEIPEGNYGTDLHQTTDRIVIDMSGMMEGKLVYAKSDYSEILSRWLNVDTSQMPPIYTLSGKVYILRLGNGQHAALQLTDFKNAKNIKGYMTIKYVYPLESYIEAK